jgi:hypothetical protein
MMAVAAVAASLLLFLTLNAEAQDIPALNEKLDRLEGRGFLPFGNTNRNARKRGRGAQN